MTDPPRLSRLAILTALSACSVSEPTRPPQACQPPRDYWTKPHNFDGLAVPRHEVSVTHAGEIYWNGARISAAALSQYLHAAHLLSPEPEIFLQTEMGVSCQTLEDVRNRMDQALDCKKPGGSTCAEGILSVWRALPTPPGTPPS